MINIGLDCKNNGVNKVLISPILVQKNPNLTAIELQVNDILRDLCEKKSFSFICNDVITTDYLWCSLARHGGRYFKQSFFKVFQ